MKDEPVSFPGPGGARLAGCLRRPAGAPRAWALLAHCFTCGKDLRAARHISDALAAAGLGVLRFDFTGLGESEGRFADTSFVSNVDDLVAAATWLQETEAAPALIVGHSLGGTAAIAAASRLDAVRAVATIGAPYAPAHAAWILDSVREELETRGEAEIVLGSQRLRVGRKLLDDLEERSIARDLQQLRRPLLVLHGPRDQVVDVDNARELFLAARHPKSFVSLDTADHLLSDPADACYAGSVIAAWSNRFLPSEEVAEPPTADVPRGVVEVVTGEGLRTEVHAAPHLLVADEPRSVGGTDEGPTPFDLLLGSLGACTSMTVRMYASRKGWPLDEVCVQLAHERTGHGAERREVIESRIRLTGALTDAQRTRLLEIADRCPVHRTLDGPLELVTRALA
jgi:uncharacterized OsmC-like protein/fermentation-respiration switch protein FrsA (DUF1100 family)